MSSFWPFFAAIRCASRRTSRDGGESLDAVGDGRIRCIVFELGIFEMKCIDKKPLLLHDSR